VKQPKELFINSVHQVRIHGSAIIPTVVLYKNGKPLIGIEALEGQEAGYDLREDFKVEIGRGSGPKLAQRVGTDGTSQRSVLGIAKDFTDHAIAEAMTIVERQGLPKPTKILVAEPLTLANEGSADGAWLQNYRDNLKRILFGKFAEIDFMPEPFAVFQYYRYGIRHALVTQKLRHVALVIDFGGGTFDTSIIETTAQGDISQGGRNSRPLAAKSIAVGGFAINRIIAEEILFKVLEKGIDKSAVRGALKMYSELKNLQDEELFQYRRDHASFARNFRKLLRSVEQAKCVICTGIANWRLDADLSGALGCPVSVPTRPLDDSSPFVSVTLEAVAMRRIYEEQVWRRQLLPLIKETLARGAAELGGRPVSIVLLSGGSSNIRWLKPLMERDLVQDLRQAEILELSENFQEIVAKGLAIECARRFYTEGDGDFRAVTYNRLCLGLSGNGNELELRKFQPDTPELEGVSTDDGVLLPSATALRGLIDKPLRWKVRLKNVPTRSLDYYYMRSSFDPENMEARQNLDAKLNTPRGAAVSRTIGVELRVREDGTAEPCFVYGHGTQGVAPTTVPGRPFYLDMTLATEHAEGATYLGFDFGTSTSSLCYVGGNEIQVYSARAWDKLWLGLNSLVGVLPYPAAAPLAQFVSATSVEAIDKAGRSALEGMLSLASYIAYIEHCTISRASSGFLKNMGRRSAGPLWALLKGCFDTTGKKWTFMREMVSIVEGSCRDEFDRAISLVAQSKHDKRVDGLDYPRILGQLGNALSKCFDGRAFGFFEQARLQFMSLNQHEGLFRSMRGPSAPFTEIHEYKGHLAFPPQFVFMFDVATGEGLPLSPLFVRGLDAGKDRYVEPDLYSYDIRKGGGREVAYKAVQERGEIVLSEQNIPQLFASISSMLEVDRQIEVVKGVTLQSRSLE
jgi:hypothetical protein